MARTPGGDRRDEKAAAACADTIANVATEQTNERTAVETRGNLRCRLTGISFSVSRARVKGDSFECD